MKSILKYGVVILAGVSIIGGGVYVLSRVLVKNSYSSLDLAVDNYVSSASESDEATNPENLFGINAGSESENPSGDTINSEIRGTDSSESNNIGGDDSRPDNINGVYDGVVYEEAYMGNMQFDESKYSMGYELCWGIPKSIYNPSDLELRTKFMLADNYDTYRLLLNTIKSGYSTYMDGISYQYDSGILDSDLNLYRSGDLDYITVDDVKNSDGIIFENYQEYGNDSGLNAIDFFDNYYVIYQTRVSGTPLFIVVDYSQTAFHPDTPWVEYNTVVNDGLTVYLDNSNIINIEGYNVIFTKNNGGIYYTRDGIGYTAEDIINSAGTLINW